VPVDDVRAELIELERTQQAETEREQRLNREVSELLRQADEAKRENLKRKSMLVAVRRKLQREEALANAQAEAERIRHTQSDLASYFHEIAADKLWYTGTGNDDAILEHQMQGAMFGAVAERWILGDEMGLGKTRTVVASWDLAGSRKIIVVAEANLCEQFAGEIMEIAPHREVINLYKKLPEKRHELLDSLASKTDCVVVVNYEIFRKDKKCLHKLHNWQADTLVVDEAHNIKSTSTANYKYIQFLVEMENECPNCGGAIEGLYQPKEEGSKKRVLRPCPTCKWKYGDELEGEYPNPLLEWLSMRSVKRLAFLTGTPILNSPDDIYPMLHLIDPTLFKSQTNFLNTYCTANRHSGKYEFLPQGIENLKPLIADRFLARTQADAGVVLPSQRVHIIPVELDKREYPQQYKVIRQISEMAQIVLDSGEKTTLMHLIAILTRKRQANVWPGGIEVHDKDGNLIFTTEGEINESVKIDTIIDHIEVLHERGFRQIVFSQFKGALAEMERRLSAMGYRVCRFDGDTPKSLRTEIKNNFYAAKREDAKWDIVLANYKTGGTGLNLTAATKMHILDEEWSPGKRDQGYARNHRMGQTQETDVYVYRIPHTIDTWIANTIHRKERMVNTFRQVMGEQNEFELSAEGLKEALRSGEML
jgi:SNF2 family DNA or RNA helicase